MRLHAARPRLCARQSPLQVVYFPRLLINFPLLDTQPGLNSVLRLLLQLFSLEWSVDGDDDCRAVDVF
jgi:hypothetical protein